MPQIVPGRPSASALSWFILVVFLFGASIPTLGTAFMLPWGPGFAVVLLWGASRLGGEIMKAMGAPDLLGNLLIGIILKNILPRGKHEGPSLRGLPATWASTITNVGLMLILLRAGLQMDIRALQDRRGRIALRLALLPGFAEALAVSGVARIVFKMPYFLALSLGFILAAVSPAVVVSSMSNLHSRGFGVAKGIPTLVMAAAMFDGIVAISGFSLFIGVAVDSGAPLWLLCIQGPTTILAGIFMGSIVGLAAAEISLWDTQYKRTFVILGLGCFCVSLAAYLQRNWTPLGARPISTGAGAVATLILSMLAKELWHKRGYPLAVNAVSTNITQLWVQLGQPLLFGVVGSSLDLQWIDATTIPRAFAIIFSGLAIRLMTAFLATSKTGFSCCERGLIAIAWGSKATIQAALCTIPLAMVNESFDKQVNRFCF